MKQWQVLKTVFPEIITDNFEFINYKESVERLDYWLDERGYIRYLVLPASRLTSLPFLRP